MKYLPLLLLPALSWAEPNLLQTINSSVNTSTTYRFYKKADLRYLNPGDSGNCAAIAYTKFVELAKRDIPASLYVCHVGRFEKTLHMFTVSGGWALDNRHRSVLRLEDMDCHDTPRQVFPSA